MPSANSTSTELDSEKGIDFILWTGDTARHDIDITNPRTAQEIFDYNRWVLSLVEERFPGVPVGECRCLNF
jgi:endopolyphosphatase